MKPYVYVIIGAILLIIYVFYVWTSPTSNGKMYYKYREECISSHVETTSVFNPNTNMVDIQTNTVCDESIVVQYKEEGYIYHWLFWDYEDFDEANLIK